MEKRIKFTIEAITDILMHKFNGKAKEKEISTLTEKEQAEAHAYRCENGNLGIPATWVRGCIINEYIRETPKGKMDKRNEISPCIFIDEQILDLETKDYEIDIRSAPAGSGYRGGTRMFCVRPLIKMWKVSGTIITSLPLDELKEKFEKGGKMVGIGSNRPNGYGRFKLTYFSEIQ